MPYFPLKILSKFSVSVTSCGNELFAAAHGKRRQEDRQNPARCPSCASLAQRKAKARAVGAYNPFQDMTLYAQGYPSEM